MTDLEILNLNIDNGGTASIEQGLKDMREFVEQKLALVHEGTTVHTNYLLCLEKIDGLLEQCMN